MAKPGQQTNKKSIAHVVKSTSQGGRRPKTSAMNKSKRRSHKAYQGQGR